MTGFSKNFVKFFSLVAVVAMFLGLMVTGCSEGDSIPAHVDFDTDSTELEVIVGVADPAAKGFDVDTNVNTIGMRLLDATGTTVGEELTFDDTAAEGVNAWTVREDGALSMSTIIAPENVEKVAAIIVAAYDKDDNLLGCYVDDALKLAAGTKTTLDFTADDAPAFITVADIAKSTKLTLTTYPEAVDGVISITVGQTAAVTAVVTVALTENIIIEDEVSVESLELYTDSTDVKLDKVDNVANTITGVKATTEDAVVTVKYTEGLAEVTSTINVKVIGEVPVPVEIPTEIKIIAKDTGISVPTDEASWNALPGEAAFARIEGYDIIIALRTVCRFSEGGNYTYSLVDNAQYSCDNAALPLDSNTGEVTVNNSVPSGTYTITATYGDLTSTFDITI